MLRGTGQPLLVVEENELELEFAVAQLESLGCRVEQAHGGLIALEILAGDRPVDLLFSDADVPVGLSKGWEKEGRVTSLDPGTGSTVRAAGFPP